MIITFTRILIASAYLILAGRLARRLRLDDIIPSRRPLWWVGLSICLLWSSFYYLTGFFSFAEQNRIAWSQSIQLLTIAHVVVVLNLNKAKK